MVDRQYAASSSYERQIEGFSGIADGLEEVAQALIAQPVFTLRAHCSTERVSQAVEQGWSLRVGRSNPVLLDNMREDPASMTVLFSSKYFSLASEM